MLKPPTSLVLPLRNSPSLAASRLTSDCHPVDPSMFHGIISFIDDRHIYIYTETYTHLYRLIYIYIYIGIFIYICVYIYIHIVMAFFHMFPCMIALFWVGRLFQVNTSDVPATIDEVFSRGDGRPFCGAFLGCVLRFTPIENLAILVFAI